MISISPALARRLAIIRQHLAGPILSPDPAGLLEAARALRCVQLDPISAVDKSHRLVLFSRVGPYDPAHLDHVLWEGRHLFEYWAHCASLVLTEDYPIHNFMMRRFPSAVPPWSRRTGAWMEKREKLRRFVLRRLRRDGPLPSRLLEMDKLERRPGASSGWSSDREVGLMLFFLQLQGKIMVAGRSGGQKLWDMSERVLPAWTPRDRLSEREVVRRSAEHSLRALGVATARMISQHFTRWRYYDLRGALKDLERKGRITGIAIQGKGDAQPWPGNWYIHADDLPALDRLTNGDWQPRTTLLSPFDNLICDRARTQQHFGFDFRIEIYVPAAKRRYGYYVLPILHGDRLIGRIDPTMDRAHGRLRVNAVYAEPDAPATRVTGRAVAGAIEQLAEFLGAEDIEYDAARVPPAWRRDLK